MTTTFPRSLPASDRTRSPRRVLAFTALLIAGALLTGCTANGGNPPGSPAPTSTEELLEQAIAHRAQFWTELDDMEKVLGGDWIESDGRTPENCLGKMRGNHYQYLGFRKRTVPVDDIHASADAMQKFWDDLGYTTQRISYADDHLIVVAEDLNGWEITLKSEGTGEDKRTTLRAETGCFRGDYSTVLVQVVAWNEEHPVPYEEDLASPTPG